MTLTKSWLQKQITDLEATRDEIPFGLDEDGNNTLAVLKLALAGMEAEPVAWRWNYGGTTSWRLQETKPNYGDNHKFPRVIQPLYTDPQPLTTSERAELENYRNAQQVVPDVEPYMHGLWPNAVDALMRYANACRAAMLQGKADGKPELSVWYGPMPESNGKTNWTAMLHRKGQHPWEGIAIDCSEYPERTLYEADRMRHLIGELADEPDTLAYDADKHSGYVAPGKADGNSPVIPDGWVIVPKEATAEMINSAMRDNETGGLDEIYELMIAAAPQQEVKP